MGYESRSSSDIPVVHLRPPEAARYLGLSVSTLAKLRCRAGHDGGPPFRRLGRAVTYAIIDLDAWYAAKEKRTSTLSARAAAMASIRRLVRERPRET